MEGYTICVATPSIRAGAPPLERAAFPL
jgi:hypothetical protein